MEPRRRICAILWQTVLGRAGVEIQVRRVVEVDRARAALILPSLAPEAVREDAEVPRLEVRARLEPALSAKGVERGLLDEILGVGAAPRQPQRVAVGRRQDLGEEDLKLAGAERRALGRRCLR